MIKIVALGLLCSFVILCVKGFNDEYAILLGIVSSIILILLSSEYLQKVLNFINELVNKSGVDGTLYGIVFKITGIGYLVEFSASIVEEAGMKSLADKLVFIGKIIIISTALPIFYAVFNMFSEIVV